MYPYPVFLGLTLYDICLCAGIIVCFVLFGFLADKHKIDRKIQSFSLICGVAAVTLGYGSAVLFQGLYNIKTLGKFELTASTGATFYGGLIGGVAVFVILYFLYGYFKFEDGCHKKVFFKVADCAVPGILIAHAIGRMGCLFAGCCHGELTNAWYGILMHGNMGYAKYVPTQLFESIFLLLLFGFLFIRSLEQKSMCLPVYLCVYAVWRFFIEFSRADYRGDTFIDALSPSQLIACILFVVGIAVGILEYYVEKRISSEADNETAE